MEPPHSGLGIASFVLAVVIGIALFLFVAGATAVEVTTPGGMDEESPIAILLGCMMLTGMALDVVAIGLGIAGLCVPNRTKIYAILGIIFSVITLLGVTGLMVLGLAVG